eukprot:4869811-Pyramimonas_sp.AAC.1
MAASLGATPILVSSSIVITFSCCDRAQQPRAPVTLHVAVSADGRSVAGVSSGIPVPPAEKGASEPV